MAATRTFSIIKPDATRRNLTGAVTKMLEEAGLRVVASKRIHMTREQAEGFYAVHKERPFFNDLCTFMTSGPVVVQVLEGENAVQRNRDIMGATNPANADEGTIRKNSPNRSRPIRSTVRTATRMPTIEIAYFFKPGRNRRLSSSQDRAHASRAGSARAAEQADAVAIDILGGDPDRSRRDIRPAASRTAAAKAASANRILFSKLSSKLRRSRLALPISPTRAVDDHRLGVQQARADTRNSSTPASIRSS